MQLWGENLLGNGGGPVGATLEVKKRKEAKREKVWTQKNPS